MAQKPRMQLAMPFALTVTCCNNCTPGHIGTFIRWIENRGKVYRAIQTECCPGAAAVRIYYSPLEPDEITDYIAWAGQSPPRF